MTGRTRIWMVVATAFTLINLGGGIYAGLQGEMLHCEGHVAGTLLGLAWMWWLTSSARRQKPPTLRPGDERLETLQQSVDAIAVEVERIGEAQRFDTKLNAERRTTP